MEWRQKLRNHSDYYYTIRDAIIAGMGPEFDRVEFRRLFPRAAIPHGVIPYTDGYLAQRRIIEGLVKAKMKRTLADTPKRQLTLI